MLSALTAVRRAPAALPGRLVGAAMAATVAPARFYHYDDAGRTMSINEGATDSRGGRQMSFLPPWYTLPEDEVEGDPELSRSSPERLELSLRILASRLAFEQVPFKFNIRRHMRRSVLARLSKENSQRRRERSEAIEALEQRQDHQLNMTIYKQDAAMDSGSYYAQRAFDKTGIFRLSDFDKLATAGSKAMGLGARTSDQYLGSSEDAAEGDDADDITAMGRTELLEAIQKRRQTGAAARDRAEQLTEEDMAEIEDALNLPHDKEGSRASASTASMMAHESVAAQHDENNHDGDTNDEDYQGSNEDEDQQQDEDDEDQYYDEDQDQDEGEDQDQYYDQDEGQGDLLTVDEMLALKPEELEPQSDDSDQTLFRKLMISAMRANPELSDSIYMGMDDLMSSFPITRNELLALHQLSPQGLLAVIAMMAHPDRSGRIVDMNARPIRLLKSNTHVDGTEGAAVDSTSTVTSKINDNLIAFSRGEKRTRVGFHSRAKAGEGVATATTIEDQLNLEDTLEDDVTTDDDEAVDEAKKTKTTAASSTHVATSRLPPPPPARRPRAYPFGR